MSGFRGDRTAVSRVQASMHVFLDFEASSLARHSVPIEVAWVFADGRSETHLIRPAPDWTDWDEEAAAIHGIGREELLAEGTPHEIVAHRLLGELGEHAVYASAPSWDGKWLSVLLRAAGLPRHAMRLKDTDEAQREAAVSALGGVFAGEALEAAVADIISRVREAADRQPVRHRALEDAEAERRLWLEIGRQARDAAERAGAGNAVASAD